MVEGDDVTDPGAAVLAVMLILTLKHFVCDYPLQTPYMLRNKGKYGHPGGILHAGIHAAASTLAFLVITPPLAVGALLVAAEFMIHYHIDWTKESMVRRRGWTTADTPYWMALGADQMGHHLTYIGMAATLLFFSV